MQESIILEEITQSLGLSFDSKKYTNSIFYEHKSRDNIHIKEFSNLDKDIIKLLYHPKVKAGLNEKEVKIVIKQILSKKQIELLGQ